MVPLIGPAQKEMLKRLNISSTFTIPSLLPTANEKSAGIFFVTIPYLTLKQ
jgi:hypothetical protein